MSHSRYLKFTVGAQPYAIPLLLVRDVVTEARLEPDAGGSQQKTLLFEGSRLRAIDLCAHVLGRPCAGGAPVIVCQLQDGPAFGLQVESVVSILIPESQGLPGTVRTFDLDSLQRLLSFERAA